MEINEARLITAVELYAGIGLAVFPLQPRGKQPATKNGFKDATTDIEKLREWWRKNPHYNIGIATGAPSGGICVIDLDNHPESGKDGFKSFEELRQRAGVELPDTWMAATGSGGRHIIYKAAEPMKCAVGIAPGVDIRADGGYIVAPPSVHPNGATYTWDPAFSPLDLPLADLPAGLLPERKKIYDFEDPFEMPAEVPLHSRTENMIRLIGSLSGKGLTPEAIRAAVEAENDAKCIPPLTDDELAREVFPAIERFTAADAEEIRRRNETAAGAEERGSNTPAKTWKGELHRFGKNGNPIEIIDAAMVRFIMGKNTIIVIEGEPYIYEGGVYRYDKGGVITKGKIRECIYDSLVTIHRIERVYKLLLTEERLQHDANDLNQHPKSWINCKNGMLDLCELKLHEHRPGYYSLNQVPFSYDPGYAIKDNSITAEFLDALLVDPEDRKMFLEYAGCCMSTYTGFQKYLILSGKGGIGKSVLVKMINRIVGIENIAAIPLQALSGRFSTRFLYGKLLNSCADLSSASMTDTGPLKMITGEDQVPAEIKGGAVFNFRPYVKLLFSANRIPTTKDEQSDAFYRRLMILHIVGRCKEFPDLEERLQADAETFFYMAAGAAHDAFKRRRLFESEHSKNEVLELYLRTDSVMAFIHDRMKKDPGAKTKTAEAYNEYCVYCADVERICLSRTSFRANVTEKGYRIGPYCGNDHIYGLALVPKNKRPAAV